MTKHVQDYLRQKKYLNTQERAFSFLALGKLSRNAAKGNIQPVKSARTISQSVQQVKKPSYSQRKIWAARVMLKWLQRVQVSCIIHWEAEGVDATGAYVEEDSYIRVTAPVF